ncbi:MAG: LamG domain-containing protein [bacterium]
MIYNLTKNNDLTVNKRFVDTGRAAHYSLLFPEAQYNPAMYSKNLYTVFCTLGTTESNNRQTCYLYNHRDNTYQSNVLGAFSSGDFHANGISIILPSGKILIATNSEHNVSIEIKKSDSAYDISSFTTVQNLTDGSPAYFNMALIGNRVYAIYRGEGSTTPMTAICITYSDDEGETWVSPYKVMEYENGDARVYPRIVYSPDKLRFFVNQSNQPVTEYQGLFYFESEDGVEFKNIDGSVTRNVITEGEADQLEVDTNFTIGNYIGFVNGICYSDGKFYLLQKNTLWIYDGSWSNKVLQYKDISNINSSGRSNFLDKGNGVFEVYLMGEINGLEVLLKLETENSFQDYTIIQYDDEQDYRVALTPFNYVDQKNTLIAVSKSQEYGSGVITEPIESYADFYLHTGEIGYRPNASGFDVLTGLVASWQFEDDFTDYTGNHDATVTSSVDFSTTAVVGKSADFIGGSDYLTASDDTDFQFNNSGASDIPYTIMFWVNFDNLNQNATIINKMLSGAQELLIYLEDATETWRIRMYDVSESTGYIEANYDFSGSFATNTWFHIAITYNGDGTSSGVSMKIDNSDVTLSSSDSGSYIAMESNGADVIMGALGSNTGIWELNGKLDEVKIYKNRILDDATIGYIYENELAGINILP